MHTFLITAAADIIDHGINRRPSVAPAALIVTAITSAPAPLVIGTPAVVIKAISIINATTIARIAT